MTLTADISSLYGIAKAESTVPGVGLGVIALRRAADRWLGAAVLAAGLLAAGEAAAAARPTTLHVFAAASLADAFQDIARRFERGHPGVAVRFNLAGSQQLATQIRHGAIADGFASADARWMRALKDHGAAGKEPRVFARNALIVIVPKTNPAGIVRLQDLARRGTKIVLGADAVPVGRYSREVLAKLSQRPEFGPDFSRRALANVVSEEENVKSVVAKVELGEADAGMVYRSDVTPALARHLRTLEVPEAANVQADYPIAVLRASKHPDEAQAFVDLVLSREGQTILKRHGLIPVHGE